MGKWKESPSTYKHMSNEEFREMTTSLLSHLTLMNIHLADERGIAELAEYVEWELVKILREDGILWDDIHSEVERVPSMVWQVVKSMKDAMELNMRYLLRIDYLAENRINVELHDRGFKLFAFEMNVIGQTKATTLHKFPKKRASD